jgi:hypothetical protein
MTRFLCFALLFLGTCNASISIAAPKAFLKANRAKSLPSSSALDNALTVCGGAGPSRIKKAEKSATTMTSSATPLWRDAYNFSSCTVGLFNLYAAYKFFFATTSSDDASLFRTRWMGYKLILALAQLPLHGIILNGYKYGFNKGGVEVFGVTKLISAVTKSDGDLRVPGTFTDVVHICSKLLLVSVPAAIYAGYENEWHVDDIVTAAVWSAVFLARMWTVYRGTHDATWVLTCPLANNKKE